MPDDPSPIREGNELPPEDLQELSNTPVEGLRVIVNTSPASEGVMRAERFVDLVKHGEDPKEAAKKVGTGFETIKGREHFFETVSKLLGTFELDAAVQKKMVEAGLNKLFIESVGSKNAEDRKIALATAKQIGQNLGISPSDGVTIDLGGLADVIKDASLPGLPEYKEPDGKT